MLYIKEEQSGRAAQFLSRHGEKVGFAAAALVLTLYMVFGVLLANGDSFATTAEKTVAEAKSELNREHLATSPGEPETHPIGWIDSDPANRTSNWGPFYATEANMIMIPKPPENPKPWLRIPAFASPKVTSYRVRLEWTLSNVEGKEEAKLDHLRLRRWTQDETKPGLDRTLAPDVTFFVDDVDPSTAYFYAITTVAADESEVEGALSIVLTAETPGEYGMTIIGFVKDSRTGKDQVILRIRKALREGTTKTKVVHCSAGEEIGFGTGYTIEAIRKDKAEIEYVNKKGSREVLRYGKK